MSETPAKLHRSSVSAGSIGVYGIVMDSIRVVLAPPDLKRGFPGYSYLWIAKRAARAQRVVRRAEKVVSRWTRLIFKI